jgi:hypothetical protein
MRRLVIEDIGKPGDPLRLAIEETTPITYPVLGFHVGDKVWLPVEERLKARRKFYLHTHVNNGQKWPFDCWYLTQPVEVGHDTVG